MKSIKPAIGCIVIVTLNLLAMEDPLAFFNIPSVLIVVGLTCGGLLFSGAAFNTPAFWNQVRRYSIASGVVGTLIGAILMLGSIDDPAAIGPSIAVALLTLLYSVLIGYFFALPMEHRANNK